MIRRGVSLLECLFAIGVVAVGLLGVIAILPIALHQVERGNVADRSLRMGQNGLSDILMREANNRNAWVWRNPNTFYQTQQIIRERVGSTSSTNTDKDPFRAYAIDPLFVAQHNFGTAPPPNVPSNSPYYDSAKFPYAMGSVNAFPENPRMERVTLFSPIAKYQKMTGKEADSVFVLGDELALDILADVSLPPLQQYSLTKRDSEGTFSWMATLTPMIDATALLETTTPAAPSNYVLSIVVFHRRDLSMQMDAVNERVVSVVSFANGGYGGGDVTLAATDELQVKSGEWVLMMGHLPVTVGATTKYIPQFRWYYVVATGGAVDSSGNLDVSLQGGDWPATLVINSQVGLIRNVAAVYEQTVVIQNN